MNGFLCQHEMVVQFNERTNLILEYEKSFQRLKVVQDYVQKNKEELSKSAPSELEHSIDSLPSWKQTSLLFRHI
jgi:hypothetical protein